ncbi:MAG: glycoside hydrolase family 2, partial [Clostridia bacterium]|nr:glycoside hydrolase family 2 [Clostridia bacterium]
MNHVSYYKGEYPRPQLWRPNYRILNGEWNFAFGDGKCESEMSCGFDGRIKINVPFTYQTAMSGIGTEERHDEVW